MGYSRVLELKERLDTLTAILDNINTQCNGAFTETPITLAAVNFLSHIPDYPLYRRYKLEYADVWAELVEEVKDTLAFSELAEQYFCIAAEYALLGEPDKMTMFVQKIDWKRWQISESQNPIVLQVYRDLVAYSRELESQKNP